MFQQILILESYQCKIDESALTGESLTIEKQLIVTI